MFIGNFSLYDYFLVNDVYLAQYALYIFSCIMRLNWFDRTVKMNDWLNALMFGVAIIALTLGLSSIVMGATVSSKVDNIMQQRVEYGFMGVSGLIIFALMVYALV